MNRFEDHLREMFANNYEGLDDDMPDAEAEWFSDLDPADVIEWAETWGRKQYLDGMLKGHDRAVSIALRSLRPKEVKHG